MEDLSDLFEAVTGTTSITELQVRDHRRSHDAATADEIELSSYVVGESKADGLAETIDDFSPRSTDL